ncbi:MAG: hypothetical protein HRT71_17825 [Flavobacteriales bacterium]|nr:hypothetical protein [Flavobacteriales bacterium]
MPCLLVAQEWELARDNDGVKIYTKDSEASSFKAFKLITIIKCSDLAIPYGILKDIEKIPDWVQDVESIEVVKTLGPDHTIEYHKIGVPWPFSDRDMVIETSFVFDGDISFRKILKQKLNFLDEKEDYVRIKLLEGYWLFEKINDNELRLTYEIIADPSGSLPSWVVNLFIVDGPFDTVTNLKKIIREAQ